MAKPLHKQLVRKLRLTGKSIKEIANEVGVSVGSVSAWVRDIELSPEQVLQLQKRMSDPTYGRRLEYLRKIKLKHAQNIERIYTSGAMRVGSLNQREWYLLGLGLYWGEGFKKDSLLGFATSDPDMATIFIEWLRVIYGIRKDRLLLRVSANFSYKDRIEDIETFWSQHLGISLAHFSKPFFQNVVWKKQYENSELYHGVIRIRVRKSVNILREILGSIQHLKTIKSGVIENSED